MKIPDKTPLEAILVALSLKYIAIGIRVSRDFDSAFSDVFDYHRDRPRYYDRCCHETVLFTPLENTVKHLFTHGYPDIAMRVLAFNHKLQIHPSRSW